MKITKTLTTIFLSFIIMFSFFTVNPVLSAAEGSITVNDSSINKVNGQWEQVPMTVTINRAGANGSKTVAGIYWRKYTPGLGPGDGWANIQNYGTNGSNVNYNFSPPSNTTGGTYQFSLWAKDGNNALYLIEQSADVTFTEPIVCTANNYGPNPGSTSWCNCAAQYGDVGSLSAQNCPQTPKTCESCTSYAGYGWNGTSCESGTYSCDGRNYWYFVTSDCPNNQNFNRCATTTGGGNTGGGSTGGGSTGGGSTGGGTGQPGFTYQEEVCNASGTAWVANSYCSLTCNTPVTYTCTGVNYRCATSSPGAGWNRDTTGKTCPSGSVCYTYTPPPAPVTTSPYCGDGACGGSETCTSCQQDCGACPANFRPGWIQTSGGDVHSNTEINVPD